MIRRLGFVPAVMLSVLPLWTDAKAGQNCGQQTRTATTTSPGSDTEKVAVFLETWSESGLQVQMIGGYIKLQNGDGEVLTAADVSETTGIQLSDDDLHDLLRETFAGSGEAPKVQACHTPESARTCSELTLTGDYDACGVGGTVIDSEDARQIYQKAKDVDGRSHRGIDMSALEVRNLQGQPVDIRALRGKPMLVALLSEKCGHSLRTLSTLTRLQKRHTKLGMVALFASSSPQAVRDVLEERSLPLAVWVSANAASVTQTVVVPTILLVDETGSVRERHVGEKMERFLDNRIRLTPSPNDSSQLGMQSR